MVETMSAMPPAPIPLHRASAGRRHSGKGRISATSARTPSLSTSLGSQLSFIKMDQLPVSDEEQITSDNATDKASKSSRRTCNPLPSWLADTFRSLAKKHPLRLLLPAGDQLTTSDQNNLAPQHEVVGEDTFKFPDPASAIDQETDSQDSPGPDFSLLTRSYVDNENPAYAAVDIPSSRDLERQRLPFSTPGPGLGSSTIVVSPKTSSSPTLWTDIHSDSDLRRREPHISTNSSDSGDFRDNKDFYEWDSLPPDLAVASPFSEIYATPGPTYYGPHVVHFDSPTEDPLGPDSDSDSEQNKFGISADVIDFQWKAFDRKDLVAQNRSKPVSFAYGPGETFDSIFSDSKFLEEHIIGTSTGPLTEQSRSAVRNNSSSPAPPVTPNPFRFRPPPEGGGQDGSSPFVPDSQERSQNSTITQKQPPQTVPDASMPRLAISQTVMSSPRNNLTGIGTNGTSPSLTSINLATLTNGSMNAQETGGNDDNSIYSRVSTESIGSWGYGAQQYDWNDY